MSVSGSERVSSYGQISLVYKSPYSLHLYVDIFYVYKELDIIQHFYCITLIYNSSHTETYKKELFFFFQLHDCIYFTRITKTVTHTTCINHALWHGCFHLLTMLQSKCSS